jgi:hypothetical protein
MKFIKKIRGNFGRFNTGGVWDAENFQNQTRLDVLIMKKVQIQVAPK